MELSLRLETLPLIRKAPFLQNPRKRLEIVTNTEAIDVRVSEQNI